MTGRMNRWRVRGCSSREGDVKRARNRAAWEGAARSAAVWGGENVARGFRARETLSVGTPEWHPRSACQQFQSFMSLPLLYDAIGTVNWDFINQV